MILQQEKRGKIITAKNKYLINAFATLAIIIFVYWILNHKSETPISAWLIAHIEQVRNFYKSFPVLSIGLFCLAHFISSTLSFPGSCTFLNILSGSVFGFWRGICIVYIITVFSGCFGYLLGMKLPLKYLENKYKNQIDLFKKNFLVNDHSYLILARLSPIFPFGALNIFLGFLKIPFITFVHTTIVGIFFDVVLLNSVGAFLSGDSMATASDKRIIAIAFFSLFISSIFANLVRSKWVDLKSRTKGLKE